MCSSVKGNERSAIFFDHMARASSLHYICGISQMLRALSVCAQIHERARTHTHMFASFWGCHGRTSLRVNRCSMQTRGRRTRGRDTSIAVKSRNNVSRDKWVGLISITFAADVDTNKKAPFSASSFHPSPTPHHLYPLSLSLNLRIFQRNISSE